MSAQHQDVAAYALGVLEPADSLYVEEHLGDCLHCALELVEFSRVVALLEPLSSRDSVACLQAPPAQLLDRLLVQVQGRRPAGRPRWVAAAVAAL
ncbi:anti-sigma factor family protein, partial [Streptomyces mesophilus]|uniref:anti-sigma factor family protein n=1 Tax=Streptomyces mesophilus TaxID=1775132 RepID=UPI00334B5668